MEILTAIGKFLMKEIDIKKLAYNMYHEVALPKLQVMVDAPESESKWDNIMLAGITQLVNVFLKPKDVVAPKKVANA